MGIIPSCMFVFVQIDGGICEDGFSVLHHTSYMVSMKVGDEDIVDVLRLYAMDFKEWNQLGIRDSVAGVNKYFLSVLSDKE